MQQALAEKFLSVYKTHPNTRAQSLGPLKAWLTKFADDKNSKELVAKREGNKLADEMCTFIERVSAKEGKPWKRIAPKKEQGAPGQGAKPATTGKGHARRPGRQSHRKEQG